MKAGIRLLLLALLSGSGSLGCATLSTMQGPKTVPKGVLQMGAGGAINLNAVPGLQLVEGVPTPGIALELSGRLGLADRADMGLRVRPIGVLLDYKFQFLEGNHLDAAFAPGIGWGGIAIPGASSFAFHEVDVHVPVYFGRQLGSGWIVFGPKVIGRYLLSSISTDTLSGSSSRFVLLGGGVGGITLGLTKRFRVGAELNVYNDFTENTGLVGEAGLGAFLDFGAPRKKQ